MATLRQRTGKDTQNVEPEGATVKDTGPENLANFFDAETCTRKGLCPVSKLRHQGEMLESHSLYFEQHGSGPEKIVFIMGLNSSSFAWVPQVRHFGRSPDHSVLVFDNRGVGYSGTPRGPYSTSGMAQDVVVLLDYVGWTEERSLHLVGISLGGMIAQELASLIPERFISLTLAVTTAGGKPWSNLPPWHGLVSLTKLLFVTDPEKKVPIVLNMVYNQPWLDSVSATDPDGRTNREVQAEGYRKRIAATPPQKPIGALSQMWAGLMHHVQPSRLRRISAAIPKVLIVSGDDDHLVRPSESRYLKNHMPEAELEVWEGAGHALNGQYAARFNELLVRVFAEGRAKLAEQGSS
ncbi:alpha beta-hydrolase [Artomyces pyxidatus]|uniref:Alpha beta-hydrolase n=1 Tax=Artomyces pyxidatus TaxID=48021 RepID=A0ACB8SKJ5_9AGAM|nr:alpha beta-hydrolase [Artomyces pyxidatus]